MNQVKTEETITLSENAVAHLKHIKANDASKAVLLLRVDAGGCSGFQYQFSIGDNADEGDLIFTHEGATLAVDPISFELVKGSTVDYVQELIGSAFVIKNPNASSSCGCGSSFSL